MAMQSAFQLPRLTEEQEKEGYQLEDCEDRVLVWHKKNHIALLYKSPDIEHKVQGVVRKGERNSRKSKRKPLEG